jgi:hypothetical protein
MFYPFLRLYLSMQGRAATAIFLGMAFCGVLSGCKIQPGQAQSPPSGGMADGASSAPFQDSMRLARKYATLSTNIAELKLEMWSRTTGAVLREFRWIPPSDPAHFGAQPVTREYPLPPRAKVAVVVDGSRRATALRSRTTLSYAGTVSPAFDRWARSVGFRIERGSAAADTANAVVFGDSVLLADVKAVAFQLYNMGTPARSVRRFAAGEGSPRTIRLRYNQLFESVPPLSVEQIRALRFPRPDEN